MKTEEILKGYDAEMKKALEAFKGPRNYLECAMDDYIDLTQEIQDLKDEVDRLKVSLERKREKITELKHRIVEWEEGENDKEIIEYLPVHLQNIRYSIAIEAIFENIEKIPIEVLEALAQNNYSLTPNS